MTDNEIIKALDCCTHSLGVMCKKCPSKTTLQGLGCRNKLSIAALDLINRLKAENNKKSKVVVKAAQEVVDLKIKAKQQRAEIERLKRDRYFVDGQGKVELLPRTDVDEIKSEAYKEFAERLKEGKQAFPRADGTIYAVSVSTIDNLVAEMTGSLNRSKSTSLEKLPHNSLCETDTYEGVTDTNVGGKMNDFKE